MKNSTTVWWIIGAIIVIALIGWGAMRMSDGTLGVSGEAATSTNATSTTGTPSTGGTGTPTSGSGANSTTNLSETYTNATHGFTISYPRDLSTQSFTAFHELNNNDWRFLATGAKRGTAVVEIPVFKVDNQTTAKKNYPLYYEATVRVGVSNDTAQCYATDDGYANQTVTNVTINGVAFKKFIFGDAAMMKYVNGASYRTIKNNKCYVIEQIQNGSSYRDNTLVGGYSDADLANFYARTTPIVMSFKFK